MKQNYFQKLVLAVLVAAPFSFASAQSLQLLNHPGVTYGDPNDWEYEIPLDVQNISGNTLSIIAKREEVNVVNGHETFFCWEECYTPAVDLGAPVTMAPNEIVTLFKSYLQPHGTAGISTVRYSFYNANDISDSVQYTFVYDIGITSGIQDLANLISQPYPNPSSEAVSLDLNLPAGLEATVQIVNVIGRTVKSQKAQPQQQKVTFTTADLAPGIYFIRTIADNKTIKVQKFTKL